MGGFDGAAAIVEMPTDIGMDLDIKEEPQAPPEVEEPPEQQDEVEPQEQQDQEQEQEPEQRPQDQTQLKARDLTKTIRELGQAHPEHARALKELKDAYFSRSAYQGYFKSPEEALDAKSTIEALGGKEGIAQLRSWETVIQDIDRRIAEGDPKVIEEQFQSSPEGMARLIPHGMKMLERTNPEAFADTVRPLVLRELDGSGITNYLQGAIEELRKGESDRAFHYLKAVAGSIEKYRELSATRESAVQNPAMQQIATERAQMRQERMNVLAESVKGEWRTHLSDSIPKAISQQNLGKNLAPEARRALLRDVNSEIRTILGADKFYMDTISGLMNRGNRAEIVKYGKDAVNRVLAQAVRNAWTNGGYESRGTAPKPKAAAAPRERTTEQPRESAAIPMAKKPAFNDIDQERTSRDMYVFKHQAYLKSGKLVSWK